MDVPYSIMDSSVDDNLSCFYCLAILNSAVMNIHIQVFVQTPIFILGGVLYI